MHDVHLDDHHAARMISFAFVGCGLFSHLIDMQHHHATNMIKFSDIGVLRSPECFATSSCSKTDHPLLTQVLGFLRFVSKAGAGSRGGGDRQFCYVNGRPVDLPKVCSQLTL